METLDRGRHRWGQLPVTVVMVAAFLMTAGVISAHATVSGENGRIAFRRYFNDDHTRGAIFTITSAGTGERQVTHPPRSKLTTEPDWSPSGRSIVYTVYPDGEEDRSRIFKIRPNGTHRANLGGSCVAPCLFDGFPSWSPNGERIAFQRGLGPAVYENKVIAIFVMRADGTHARQITQQGADPTVDAPYEDQAPTWSPTGDRLAFERFRRSTDHQAIFTVRLDGTGLRRITPWRLDASQPDWSPNGRWIAFRTQESSDRHGDIALVRPSGNQLHIITSGPGKWQSCSFSPNGKRITAGHNPGHGAAGNADVYTMKLNGTYLRNVTNSNRWESAPDWGPRPT